MMVPNDDPRRSEAAATLSAMETLWPAIVRELLRMRATKVESLVTENDEQTRGAVKCIDELLRLPNTLQQELADPLPE